jgi:hypothetical protein
MLPFQRFVTKRLCNFSLASFANVTPPQQQTDLNKRPVRKAIDQETLEYLQKRIKTSKGQGILDKENYRVDVGLLINRQPIFLQFAEKEMEATKFRYRFSKKYKLMMPLPKELLEFTEKEPSAEGGGEVTDELPTHEIVYPDGTRITYSGNSKYFTKVDPNVTDKKSIQYASDYRVYLMVKDKESQKWTFPSTFMADKATFSNSKNQLFETISQNKWKATFAVHTPVCVTKRELTESEKKNVLNKKAIGVKTFYFIAYHESGQVSLNPELYDDYAWVTRLELNQYLDKASYDNIVHSIALY